MPRLPFTLKIICIRAIHIDQLHITNLNSFSFIAKDSGLLGADNFYPNEK